MSTKIYLGIDNGTTGTIAAVTTDNQLLLWSKTPTFKVASYKKGGGFMSRVDKRRLGALLLPLKKIATIIALLENPLVDPMRAISTLNAGMALEATLTVLEDLKISHQFTDARSWQKLILHGVSGTANLKKASRDVARRLYPTIEIPDTEDGDAVCLAEYARRMNM